MNSIVAKYGFYAIINEIIRNSCFDNKVEITTNSNKKKEVFIHGMKTSTTVRIGDP